MSIRVNIHPYLYHLTNNQEVVEVDGITVGECLKDLIKQFPDIKQVLFDQNGKFINYVNIYINMEDAFPNELAKSVKDGDELHILPIIMGG